MHSDQIVDDHVPGPARPGVGGLSERIEHRQSLVLALVWGTAALVLCLAWWYMLAQAKSSEANVMASAERDLANLTRVSQEHALRTLRGADQVSRFVADAFQREGLRLDLRALVERGTVDAEIFNQVGVIDAAGMYVLSSLAQAAPIDLSDREHFRVQVAADTGALFVSKPVLGRASGKWSIQLTRRINAPGGRFAGVVVVSIDAGYFTRFYSDLNLGPDGVSGLYGTDGVARARIHRSVEQFGVNTAASQALPRLAAGQLEGAYITDSVVDGVRRLFYFRKIPGYALYVTSGFNLDELLAGHRHTQGLILVQTLIGSLLVLALSAALTRHLRQLRAAMLAQREAQAQQQHQSEQLRAVFGLSPDGFLVLDLAGRVRYFNPMFSQLLPHADQVRDGMTEEAFWTWLDAQAVPGQAPLERGAASRQFQPFKLRRNLITLATEPPRTLQLSVQSAKGFDIARLLCFRDVTRELAFDSMRSDFLSTAAHELRTPMSSIHGFTEELLSGEHSAEDQREFLGIIFRQSRHIANLLDELLDLSRIEAERGQSLVTEIVDLAHLVRSVVQALALPEGRSAPVLDLPGAPVCVPGDPGKLTQAVSNILTNAYKYSTAPGEVRVRVMAPPSDGDGDSQGALAAIVVEDQGIGMTPEQLARVFERFYRADKSGRVPGTGLGMSIVREIVELHGGQVQLHSVPGQGTRVAIQLPA